MNNKTFSFTSLLSGAVLGALFCWLLLHAVDNSAIQSEKIITLENKILDLEFALAQKDVTHPDSKMWSNDLPAQETINEHAHTNTRSKNNTSVAGSQFPEYAVTESTVDAQTVLKNLSTTSDRDPRPFSEKANDLLASSPGEQGVAIVSQSILDMADNAEHFPDYELQTLYQNQTNSAVKRVAAQVLSIRGDNSLLDKQINAARTGLQSENPVERQKTLTELAKTHYAGAANLITPLLKDADTGVKLDALLALRATGNQSHIHLLASLTDHPDPAISWLANDVAKTLQNLSDTARTHLTAEDVAAELPTLVIP